MLREILQANLFLPAEVRNLIEVIEELARTVYEKFITRTPLRDERFGSRNRVYFMLEYEEAQLMHSLLAQMLLDWEPNSLILLHDGFWSDPPPPTPLLDQAWQNATRHRELLGLRIKITPLQNAYRETSQKLLAILGSNAAVTIKHTQVTMLAKHQLAWWDELGEPAQRHDLGIQQQIVSSKRKLPPLPDDQRTIDLYFKRRKL